MKKIILAVFLLAGAASLHAASPFQQDTTKHKMEHKKMSSDTAMHKSWNKSDTSMHHNKMKGKMKKDSTGAK
jgi:hypothetical protein